MHFRWLALKNVRLLYPSLKFRKNFNLFSFFWWFQCEAWQYSHFFSLFWLQILNLPASLRNKNTRVGPFPWKRSVLQNPDRERTNQSEGICLRLALPYNNIRYFYQQPAQLFQELLPGLSFTVTLKSRLTGKRGLNGVRRIYIFWFFLIGSSCFKIANPKNGVAIKFGFFLSLRCNRGLFFNPKAPGFKTFQNPRYTCKNNKWMSMTGGQDSVQLINAPDCMGKNHWCCLY